jgi:arsenite methyltransferase
MTTNLKKPVHLEQIETFYRAKLEAIDATTTNSGPKPPPLAPDYTADILARLPPDLSQTSFGCGHPLAFAGVKPGDTVLDLGCGAGLDLIIAAEMTGPKGRVIGVDMSEEMVGRARDNVERAGLTNVEVMTGVIEALPLTSGCVDWVISNCVINLSPDKAAVFREVHRVMRPGGQMLISDLVAENLPAWVTSHKDLYAACISGAISQSDYLDAARVAGLTDLAVLARQIYGADEVRALVRGELAIALDVLAARFGMSVDQAVEYVGLELADRIQSVKVYAMRPLA